MTIQESTQVNTQSELLKALATSAISFASDEEANAAGFYWNDGVDFAAASTAATFGFDAWADQIKGAAKRGLILQYLDPFTKQPVGYSRVRYECPQYDPKRPDKPTRYKGPLGARVHSFFPCIIDWPSVIHDVSSPLILIEGEKKAYSAAVNLGIPTIGLGGVNSYKESSRSPEPLLADLMGIKWEGRTVYICYDSDAVTNENVQAAQQRLADALLDVKAKPYIVTIPAAVDGGKQGLDDYIISAGAAEVTIQITRHSVILPELLALQAFRKQCAYIDRSCVWFDTRTGLVRTERQARLKWADCRITKTVVRAGKLVKIDLPAITAYEAWKGRRIVQDTDCAPGKPTIFVGEDKKTYANTWQNTRPPLNNASVQSYVDFVEMFFVNTPELVPYWHDWLATIVQQDVKMHTAWLFYSRTQGTGKSLLASIVGGMFGVKGFNNIRKANMAREIATAANAVGRQLVLMDELNSHGSRQDAEDLKTLITSDYVNVNIKYEPDYQARDYRNYIFTTNKLDAIYIEPKDRRYFYVPAREVYLEDELKQSLLEYLTPEGAGALRQYYINYQISEGFNKGTRPPETEARTAAINSSMSNVQSFLHDLVSRNTTYDNVTVWQPKDLAYLAVIEKVVKDADPRRFGKSMSEAGIDPRAKNVAFKTDDGKRTTVTFYTFGDVHANADASTLRKIYEDETVARTNLLAGVQGNMKF